MKKILAALLLLPFVLGGCLTASEEPWLEPGNQQEQVSQALLDLAQSRIDEGNLEEALDAYRASLNETPQGPFAFRALLGLAGIEQEQGRLVAALTFTAQALDMQDIDPRLRLRGDFRALDLEYALRQYEQVSTRGVWLLQTPPAPLTAPQRLAVLDKLLGACAALKQLETGAMAINQVFKTDFTAQSAPDAAWLDDFSNIAMRVYPDYAPFLKEMWPSRDGQLMAELIWAKYYLRLGPLIKAQEISGNLAGTPDLEPAWQEVIVLLQDKVLQGVEGGMQGHVGIILPLSGQTAAYGKPLATAIEMGLGVIAGQTSIVLFMEDDANDPARAASAVDKLVNERQVLAIIGPLGSKSSQAAAERAQALQVPMISLSQGSQMLTDGGFVFQNYISPRDQAEALVDALISNKNKYRVAILAPSNNFGKGFSPIMEEVLSEKGGQAVVTRYYSANTTDFASIVRELRGAYSFDALFIADNAERGGQIVAVLDEAKINTIIMGTNLWHSGKFILSAGLASNGVLFPNAYDSQTRQSRVPEYFINQFKQAVGRAPNVLDAHGFDVGLILRQVLNEYSVTNRQQVAEHLHQIKSFPGLCGMLTVQEDGKINKPLTIFTVNNGKFVPLYRSAESF